MCSWAARQIHYSWLLDLFFSLVGLFGTNNAEYADDFRLPDGSIASDIVDFVRSWELSGDKTCDSLNNEDFVPKCSTKISPRCHALFKAKSSQFSRYEII